MKVRNGKTRKHLMRGSHYAVCGLWSGEENKNALPWCMRCLEFVNKVNAAVSGVTLPASELPPSHKALKEENKMLLGLLGELQTRLDQLEDINNIIF